MPRPHIAMRKIRDVLRLRLGEGLSLRQVSASLGMPYTTVADTPGGPGRPAWPGRLPEDLDDDALEAGPVRQAGAARRPAAGAGLGQKVHIASCAGPASRSCCCGTSTKRPSPTATPTASSPSSTGLGAAPRCRHAPRAQGGREALRRLPRPQDPDLRRQERRRWPSRPSCSLRAWGRRSYLYAEATPLPGAAALGDRPRARLRGHGRLPGHRGAATTCARG